MVVCCVCCVVCVCGVLVVCRKSARNMKKKNVDRERRLVLESLRAGGGDGRVDGFVSEASASSRSSLTSHPITSVQPQPAPGCACNKGRETTVQATPTAMDGWMANGRREASSHRGGGWNSLPHPSACFPVCVFFPCSQREESSGLKRKSLQSIADLPPHSLIHDNSSPVQPPARVPRLAPRPTHDTHPSPGPANASLARACLLVAFKLQPALPTNHLLTYRS